MSDVKEQSIYEFLVAQVAIALPNKKKLRNKYDLEDNDDQFLKDGYAVNVGEAENSDTLKDSYLQQLTRSYSITITERVEGRDRDADKYDVAEKELITKKEELVSHIIGLNKNKSKIFEEVTYLSDGGVELIFGDKKNYLFVTVSFAVTYGNLF